MVKYIANSIGQHLDQHLLSVGILSRSIVEKMQFNPDLFNDKFHEISFLTGLFHDIGKLDPNFQGYIKSKIEEQSDDFDGFHNPTSLELRASHQEISWAILNSYDIFINDKKLDGNDLDFVSYSVYWHHKKIQRDKAKDFESNIKLLESLGNDLDILNANIIDLVSQINSLYKITFDKELNLKIVIKELDKIRSFSIPTFKTFNETRKKYSHQLNARNTILRAALIAADRSISTMNDSTELNAVFNSKRLDRLIDRVIEKKPDSDFNLLADQIKKGLNDGRFNDEERNRKQEETANLLNEKAYGILAGPPGSGKTKIALDWVSKKNPQKVIWICPRVNICQSIFTELTHEYLPNSKIEIITGEFKQTKYGNKGVFNTDKDKLFSGDFIVTTIDSLLSRMNSNNNAKDLPNILSSVFIFDEYHEFMNLPGMFFLFKELMYLLQNIKTDYLLMSATPNPFFLKQLDLKDFDSSYHIVKAWDFNNEKYKLTIKTYNDYRTEHPASIIAEKSIFIYNSVEKAQFDYLNNLSKEKSILFHSSFTKEDKNKIFIELMNNFGKNKINNYDTLRAGPIVQASLNISQDNLYTDICSPENLLQRFGRCNRFGKPIVGTFTVFKPASKKNNSIMAYLSKVEFSTNISFAFLSLIEERLSGKEYTRQELADLYYEFHENNSELYAEDFKNVESEAFSILTTTNGFEPLKFLNKKTKEFKENVLAGGFRGSSIYILPLKAEYKDNKICPINEYLWNINDKNINPNILITADPDSNDLKQLITDFSSACKHLDKKKYNNYNNSFLQLTYRAKSPDSPIYVNYNLTDQKKANVSIKDEYLFYVPYDEKKISLGLISKEFMDKNNNK